MDLVHPRSKLCVDFVCSRSKLCVAPVYARSECALGKCLDEWKHLYRVGRGRYECMLYFHMVLHGLGAGSVTNAATTTN